MLLVVKGIWLFGVSKSDRIFGVLILVIAYPLFGGCSVGVSVVGVSIRAKLPDCTN